MKIWLRYLIGCALGLVMGFLLQGTNETAVGVVNAVTEFALRAGRYALLPLVFFSMTVAVYELYTSKIVLKTAVHSALFSLVSTAVLTLLGAASVLAFRPPRIPIALESATEVYSLGVWQNVLKLVPASNFASFLDGEYLLPLMVFAGFAGAGCASVKSGAKPALTLFDSLSRVSYAVMSFFTDMLAVGFIAVTCSWMFNFSGILKSPALTHLFVLLNADIALVVLVLYPLALRLVLRERHPYRIVYASIAPILAAFFSGNSNLTLGVSLRHTKESLGVRPPVNSACLPLFSAFARGGSAMVLCSSFLVVLRSYSDMGVWHDVPWILLASFVFSFLLGALPVNGAFVALAVMCSVYGGGFEMGYLIVKPVAFFLCSAAAVVDAVTAIVGTYYVAHRVGMVQHQELRSYI